MAAEVESFVAHPIERAAKICGISRSRLYELIRDGELPISKIGRRTVIADEDLRALIRRHRVAR